MVRIYALTDPRDDRIRYVGQTSISLKHRLNVHVHNARIGRGGGAAVREWIAGLLAEGLRPAAIVLEVTEPSRALEVEARYIAEMPGLLNVAAWSNVRFLPAGAALLGKMPDASVAQIVGMDERAVMRARKRHGIASYAATTGNDGRFRAAAP
jgi:hypothetical protein